MPTRVLIVDDSAFMRTMLTRFLSGAVGVEVIGTAKNGLQGVEKAVELGPDVITLDIEMPEMDGLTALKVLRKKFKRAGPSVLMCSSLTVSGSHEALEALKLGAADFIAKDPSPSADHTGFGRELVTKVRAIGKATRDRRQHRVSSAKPSEAPRTPKKTGSFDPASIDPAAFDLIAIGSSTGGPPMLERLIPMIPEQIGCPVLIAQHMPALFTASMAQRLNAICDARVRQVDTNMPLLAGNVYIIVGGKHGRLKGGASGRLRLEIVDELKDAHYTPSVNELMGSAGEVCGSRVLGMMLTGMGDDGLVGTEVLKARGGTMLSQDEASCVVYGMPRVVAEAGLSDAVLTPEQFVEVFSRFGGAASKAA